MKRIFLAIMVMSNILCSQQKNPIQIVKTIADRIIKETDFAFEEVEQKPVTDVQVIDFKNSLKENNGKHSYAAVRINVKENKELYFGCSYSSPIKIWLNNGLIFQSKRNPKFEFREIAYSMFTFQDTVTLKLVKGINNLLIGTSASNKAVVYFREITEPEKPVVAKFQPLDLHIDKYTWPWCYFTLSVSKKNNNEILNPSKEFTDSLFNNQLSDKYYSNIPKPNLLKKLIIDPKNTFKKDSYADWNYPNGALIMTILKLYQATNDSYLYNFAKKYCDFAFDHMNLFKKQYFENHDLRTNYYRIFRKCMLDDAGSPTLPFAELELKDKIKKYGSLIDEMVDYVTKGQVRLSDGTLCRPEPEKWTIWADDLFMSVPLIVKYGAMHNQRKYYDDAAKQIINFNKYLFDAKTGLYKHGWFSRTNEKSKIFWGRANGWIIWAETEALKYIPKSHPSYKVVEAILKKHLEGVLSYQDKSGMWHQILDDKTSFEESSCTAMFIIGLSNAIISGIIDKKYLVNVESAWNALSKNISEDGIVKDICCGTGIGFNAEFYKTRDRFNNDPRGLGAVIYSAIEYNRLLEYNQKK